MRCRQMAEKRKSTQQKSGKNIDKKDNTVFVGSKPTMSYVLAVVTQFSEGQKIVHLKARGRAISRAVDVAEIVRNRFVTDTKIEHIAIATDEIKTDKGDKMNVSSIQIDLKK